MYMLAMGGYFLIKQLFSQGRTGSSSSGHSGHSQAVDADDEITGSSDVTMSRMFKNFDGQWVSYMQSGAKSDSMLLMLHRTSSTAELEFSSVFSGLASTNARLVAPDRPCHGFSPCPTAGEPQDVKWLSNLVKTVDK